MDKTQVNEAQVLHTAARRYCLWRHGYWSREYGKIRKRKGDRQADGQHYTDEALNAFPRYNILNAIRVELERLDPMELVDFESVRKRLILLGEKASDEFTRDPIGPIDEAAIVEERVAFRAYLERLTPAELSRIQPLAFRRVLSVAQSAAIWLRLRERWRITEAFWYPLAGPEQAGVTAFRTEAFEKAMPAARLLEILKQEKVDRVWELREFGPEYEQDVSLLDVKYHGAEGYWSSESLDWIVYASHENSVTIGGGLLKKVQSAWPEWKDHLWAGPF